MPPRGCRQVRSFQSLVECRCPCAVGRDSHLSLVLGHPLVEVMITHEKVVLLACENVWVESSSRGRVKILEDQRSTRLLSMSAFFYKNYRKHERGLGAIQAAPEALQLHDDFPLSCDE